MTTRLEFCKREIVKHQEESHKLNKLVQELNNLLPPYKEKVAFQEFVRELKQTNQSA
ncbi:hypothetical protein [Bacillus cereus]|uniref:hypothetical protein n=1 Tax=Bacillus cereus TaxID=1396 RepID=UPI0014839AF2|nr:hypothetical protein [Bacillus cereus]